MSNVLTLPVAAAVPAPAYSVKWKWIGIAYIAEVAIIAGIIVSQYQFAARFAGKVSADNPVFHLPNWLPAIGGDHTMFFAMAMLGGLVMATVELCRVPLMCIARTHSQRSMRAFCWILALLAVLVSAKSLAQIFEQQYHTRLVEVTETANHLEETKAALAKAQAAVASPAKQGDAIADEIKAASTEKLALNKNLDTIGKRPASKTYPIRGAKGRITGYRTVTPAWDGSKVQDQIDVLDTRIAELNKQAEGAGDNLDAMNQTVATAKQAVIEAESERSHAVLLSQLHSFTGMVHGKAPNDVTDAEVYSFMRFFILFAALLGSMVATGLAAAAFTRNVPPKAPKPAKPAITEPVTYEIKLPARLAKSL